MRPGCRRSKLQKAWDDAAKNMAEKLQMQHKYPAGWTKYEVPPTVNVQDRVVGGATSVAQQDKDRAAAVKALQTLLDAEVLQQQMPQDAEERRVWEQRTWQHVLPLVKWLRHGPRAFCSLRCTCHPRVKDYSVVH